MGRSLSLLLSLLWSLPGSYSSQVYVKSSVRGRIQREGCYRSRLFGEEPQIDGGEENWSGCSSQNWMTRKSRGRVTRRIVRTNQKRISSNSCILWKRRIKSQNCMTQSTSPFCKLNIAESTSTFQSHPPCARDSRQYIDRWTVPDENGRLLNMRKFKKRRKFVSRIGQSGANTLTKSLS